MSPKGTQKLGKSGQNGTRDAKGHFLPGNPGGGRPAVAADIRKRLQRFMDEEGLALLLADARKPGKPGHPARELVMAYAYGKPSQKVDLGGDAPMRIVVEYVTVNPDGR